MNQNTDNLSLEELIKLIESNYGYGRETGENEVKRIIKAYKDREKIVNVAANISIARWRGRLDHDYDGMNGQFWKQLDDLLREQGTIL